MPTSAHDSLHQVRMSPLLHGGDNYKEMRNSGIKLTGISGHLHLPEIQVVEQPMDHAPYQLVIVAVKAWQVKRKRPVDTPCAETR